MQDRSGSINQICQPEKVNHPSSSFRPFDKPESVRIAVKVINHLGNEVMKGFRV